MGQQLLEVVNPIPPQNHSIDEINGVDGLEPPKGLPGLVDEEYEDIVTELVGEAPTDWNEEGIESITASPIITSPAIEPFFVPLDQVIQDSDASEPLNPLPNALPDSTDGEESNTVLTGVKSTVSRHPVTGQIPFIGIIDTGFSGSRIQANVQTNGSKLILGADCSRFAHF